MSLISSYYFVSPFVLSFFLISLGLLLLSPSEPYLVWFVLVKVYLFPVLLVVIPLPMDFAHEYYYSSFLCYCVVAGDQGTCFSPGKHHHQYIIIYFDVLDGYHTVVLGSDYKYR